MQNGLVVWPPGQICLLGNGGKPTSWIPGVGRLSTQLHLTPITGINICTCLKSYLEISSLLISSLTNRRKNREQSKINSTKKAAQGVPTLPFMLAWLRDFQLYDGIKKMYIQWKPFRISSRAINMCTILSWNWVEAGTCNSQAATDHKGKLTMQPAVLLSSDIL